MMKYSDIDQQKSAFVFELDNVIYPEKDYLFQVYYLFASFLEYTELVDAKLITALMVDTYNTQGKDAVFDKVKEKFAIDEKYRINFQHLLLTVKLPLKLLVYQALLDMLQEIVVDRKKIFIVANDNPALQLNKIKQTEWHGLENYLFCYFAEEISPMPEPDVLHLLMKEHGLARRDVVMVGYSEAAANSAEACGIDYYNIREIL
ncbi:HAD family hydrolase [Mucilaginibacter sp. UR6-11]|uniref:HAD hydrolase-like protein n=1 Tax=Mucilaginibacter sp. UR6-11 TaxID=1435644 RepID=UPI001E2BBACC|nr:HAD family hydrolase [Mucilaginibacter sp. UR6-11]MCC8425980.1 HAD family hydrolase [Mucilaginibacter sp. UR6-11]